MGRVEIVTRGVDPRPEEGDRGGGGGGEKNIETVHRHLIYHLYSKYIDFYEHCPWLKAGA